MINTQLDIRARQYGSAAEILEAARRRRERLFGSRPVVANENRVQIEAPKPQKAVPMWSVVQIEFDHHVLASAVYIRKSTVKTMRYFIKKRAIELGFAYDEIVGKSRLRNVAAARQQIIYECSRHFNKSLPEIGRAFNRDHTTTLHSIRIISAKLDPDGEASQALKRREKLRVEAYRRSKERAREARKAGKYTPTPGQLEVLKLMAQGNSYSQIASMFDITEKSVRERVMRVRRDTHVKNVHELVALAVRRGWVK